MRLMRSTIAATKAINYRLLLAWRKFIIFFIINLIERNPVPTFEENLAEEEKRVRYLSRLADVVSVFIARGNLSVLESCYLLHIVHAEAMRLFPDKAAVYDLVYQPRFARLVAQYVLNAPEWMN